MTISREIQTQLAKSDYDAIENAWLQHLASEPADLDYFVGVARALTGVSEDERARLLLELLDAELRRLGRWRERLALLRRAGGLLMPAELLHGEILATLRELHGASPNFSGLAEAGGLHRATEDIPKTWEKVDRLEGLLAFDVGAFVWMEGKGAGRVVEVNLGLESFKVDFERHSGLNVGFRAAGKMLKPLPPGHLQRRKLEDPQALARMRDDSPGELLRAVLEGGERPLTAAEIRQALTGIVAEEQWTAFWGAARKHPNVVTAGSGGRQAYGWAASAGDAHDALWRSFVRADTPAKLEMLRRGGDRDPALRDRMAAGLAALAARALPDRPAVAFEIAWGLERAGLPAPEVAPWSPAALVGAGDPRALLGAIADRGARERAYALVRELRPDWSAIFADALGREEDPRLLTRAAEELRAAGAPELERFLDQTLAQPRKNAAGFMWLIERAAEEPALAGRNPLRLLQQTLAALGAEEFAAFRPRLRAAVESGGTLPRLLPRLTEEQALPAYEAVERAPGLERFTRQPLLTALELRFPSLRAPQETPLYATPAAIAARRRELQQLLEVEIPRNRKAIEEARAMGDLRENFEYKSARQRHEYLAARSSALDGELRRVRPLDSAAVDASEARIGTRLRLRSASGEERQLTILGPWESDPERGIVSYESELASGLLGRRAGETVEVEGRSYSIAAIEPYE